MPSCVFLLAVLFPVACAQRFAHSRHLMRDLADTQRQRDSMAEEISVLRSRTQSLQQTLDQAASELQETTAELRETRRSLEDVEQEREELQQALDDVRADADQSRQRLELKSQKKRELKGRLNEVSNSVRSCHRHQSLCVVPTFHFSH